MKVLVVGGTRFVGLRLVRRLAQQGYDLTLLNRGKTQAQLPPGVNRLYADRRYPEQVNSALAGQSFDIVFDMTGYQPGNVEPMVDIFAGRIRHYIFQSTCGVYAQSETLPISEDFPIRSPVPAVSGLAAYEFEKAQCEQLLLQAFREKGFPVTIFRCPLIYGPENWMDDREGSYFLRLMQKRPILIPGNGATILQFTYVDDLSQAHLSVMGKEQTWGQVYNIADAHAITINGYIDILAEVVGVMPNKIYLEPSVVRKLKTPPFPFTWERNAFYSVLKAGEHFGYWPAHNLRSGLEETFRWWLRERGAERMQFVPGRLGHDVDLTSEEEVAQRFGSA